MPSNVPAPSKGALRALRNLALGTSCTVAFGIGVVTEDRRRRIHSARKVHDNAKNIKSSRRYHNSGASPAPSFEEEVARYGHFSPSIEGDSPQVAKQRWNREPGPRRKDSDYIVDDIQHSTETPGQVAEDISGANRLARVKEVQSMAQSTSEGQRIPETYRRGISIREITENVTDNSKPWTMVAAEKNMGLLASEPLTLSNERQNVENEIKQLLGDDQSSLVLDTAIAKFRLLYPSHVRISNIDDGLLDLVRMLVDACQRHSRFAEAHGLLEAILQSTTLSQQQFDSFRPASLIHGLLEEYSRSHCTSPSKIRESRYKSNRLIRAATELFLTPISDKAKADCSSEMYAAGYKLCQMAFEAKLHFHIESIYWQLSNCRADRPPVCTDILILSACARGRFDDATGHYTKLFRYESPNARTFNQVTSAVLHGLFGQKKLDKAEEVLIAAGEIVKRNYLKLGSDWIMRLLGERWRMRQKISLSMALFNRIEHLAVQVSRPQLVYSVIIQHCVEAGREDDARAYMQKLTDIIGPDKPDIRICGHFALAKAMRNDWCAVEDDFRTMQAQAVQDPQQYTAAFTPILKLFAATHGIGELEGFVKLYLERFGVIPDMRIANIVVEAYAKAKEIDAIPRWLEYARSLQLNITVVTFNILFHACARVWNVPFDDLHRLYQSVKKLDETFVDERTLSILRISAIKYDKAHPDQEKRKLDSLKNYGSKGRRPDSHSVFQKMLVAMNYDSPLKALAIFTKAKSEKLPLAAEVVGLAVQAAIENEVDGYDVASRIIKDAQDDGHDVGTVLGPLLSHQFSNDVAQSQHVSYALSQLIESLDRRGVNLSWRIVTRAVSTLMYQNRTREALDLWTAMSEYKESSSGHGNDTLSVVDLSVLLKGFLLIKDTSGIQWIIQRMSANDIVPDCRFKRQLKNARGSARKEVEAAKENVEAQQWLKTIEHSYKVVIGERQQATEEAKEAQWKTVNIVEEALLEQNAQDPAKMKHLKEAIAERRSRYQADSSRRWVITHNGSREYGAEERQEENHGPWSAAAANWDMARGFQ